MEHDPLKDPLIAARPPVETLSFKTGAVEDPKSVFAELAVLLNDLRKSKKGIWILGLSIGVAAVLILNMVSQVYLNRWQGTFFRAIERKDLSLLGGALVGFIFLVAILLSIVVSQSLLHQRLTLRLRDWLAHRLLDGWLSPGAAYRLGITSDEAVNPDQRIQEDVRNFSEMSTDIAVGVAQSAMLLVSFIGVLWMLSSDLQFSFGGYDISVPGYMVWAAILYAIVGSFLTAWVGRPLMRLNEERYAREAKFRFSLVRVSESSESIAFYSGERDERRLIDEVFDRVLGITWKLSLALARLSWITSGYGWLLLVIPVLVALPGYLRGDLDLGGLMMVVGAFNQVQGSLRWFIDNYSKIASWRAALRRVSVFWEALVTIDRNAEASRIRIETHEGGRLAFERLRINLVDGEVVIADATAEVFPGERVLITGKSGSGKSTLFRAVGGLWPWGTGVIQIPSRDRMMFLPQRPYMPMGPLWKALVYPSSEQNWDRNLLEETMKKVNLEEFIPVLDETDRWDKLMSLGQQQRLAFGRIALHRPQWIFLDEATSALDGANERKMFEMLLSDLPESTVMGIDHRNTMGEYYQRALHLKITRNGAVLRAHSRSWREPGRWGKAALRFWRRTENPPPVMPQL